MGMERAGRGEVFVSELCGNGGKVDPARRHFRCGNVAQGMHGHGHACFLAGTTPFAPIWGSACGSVFPTAADEYMPIGRVFPETHPCFIKICLWRTDEFCAACLGHIYGHGFGSPAESRPFRTEKLGHSGAEAEGNCSSGSPLKPRRERGIETLKLVQRS